MLGRVLDLRIHVTYGTAEDPNERLEVVFALEIVILRDYRARAIKQADIEDGPAKSDVEGVTHERASSKVETSDIRDLAQN